VGHGMIQVGTGGFGATWCRQFLPPSVREGRIKAVAAVDVNPAALQNARRYLGLPPERCYADIRRAFDERPADFCTVVVPPADHEQVVDLALEYGLDVLSEKPIADSLEASVRIAEKVARAGRKMGVTMSHRFDQDKTTLREELRSGRHGRIGYVVLRLTCNCRAFGQWGPFRHEIPNPLLVDAAVHHLDILADLVDDECELVWAEAWNPPWGEYAGPSQALVTMRFRNGGRALYEGAKANAAGLNGWTEEYVRAECELGTVILTTGDSSTSRTTRTVRGRPPGRAPAGRCRCSGGRAGPTPGSSSSSSTGSTAGRRWRPTCGTTSARWPWPMPRSRAATAAGRCASTRCCVAPWSAPGGISPPCPARAEAATSPAGSPASRWQPPAAPGCAPRRPRWRAPGARLGGGRSG